MNKKWTKNPIFHTQNVRANHPRDVRAPRADATVTVPPPAPARSGDRPPVRLPRLDAARATPPQRSIRVVVPREIFLVDDALDAVTCETIVRALEDGNGFVRVASRGGRRTATRSNGRFSTVDGAFAEALWTRAGGAEAFRERGWDLEDPVGLNPHVRVYRYVTGDRFGAHVDERVEVEGRRSEYTMLVYLSENVTGGDTIFYDARGRERARVSPKIGRALYFRHGAELPEHEGEAVRGGVKYVLRSDVLF